MSERIRIAGVQMDVRFADPGSNVTHVVEQIATTAGNGARLTVFPECVVSGYCFDSKSAAWEAAETIPGPATDRVAEACQRHDTHVVFGMLERSGDDLFNTAVLVGPDGVIARYRKAHLPGLGVDRFTTPGAEPFAVHEVAGLRLGMNICYDYSFPEAARVLMLKGADLIVLPTNWPEGSRKGARYLINARAHENHLYYLAVDRVGRERGFDFIGQSRCCDPTGDVIAELNHDQPGILYAEIDPAFARQKHLVKVPGKHEVHRVRDRRPDLYETP